MVNINPLTTAAVIIAAGAADVNSLATLYSFTTVVADTAAKISTILQSLTTPFGAGNADFLSGTYVANHQGLDDLFDKVAITVSAGKLIVASKATGSTLFDAPVSLGTIGTGTTYNSIPAPTQLEPDR
jgi:hypothetical protein